ncbi:helix-turn-helix transcriptional regulator [Methylobacterium sp. E-016]|uniref:helix-turn-helix domain-containing protein n=1 Tax=Methylobacterium sp. E-016 TaxID=2836556 RepID=UPI001FBADBD0|nr:helix-turn-helix transcriptional regulator [Methylobacterium sp. E-016]MCJ2078062.1 helix-turn-helix transcriptional regulator [Methylobacterium sp. E-016]
MADVIEFSEREKADIEADSYFTTLEAIEFAASKADEAGISPAIISKRSGIDAGSLSKLLNGRKRNITLKTLFTVMKAMNRKVYILSEDRKDIKNRKPNFNFDHEKLLDADFEVTNQGTVHLIGRTSNTRAKSLSTFAKVGTK